MSRDHRKLRVFKLADDLVPEIYRITKDFPPSERFSLQLQLRRAAVSAAANIVEGSARRSTREYVHFLQIATGSSAEMLYLLELAMRLELVPSEPCNEAIHHSTELVKGLKKLVASLTAQNHESGEDTKSRA